MQKETFLKHKTDSAINHSEGNGEVPWYEVKGIIANVQEMERGSEGAAFLLNDVWGSVVIYFGCVSFRILWIKFQVLKG